MHRSFEFRKCDLDNKTDRLGIFQKSLSEAKLKKRIFDGSSIRKLIKDNEFKASMTTKKKAA
ncbi:hypothetical protein LAZ67_1000989 [Cordylochernes scorpioides]|uniref:Uncharacterized protein n=1 Tax=Cordylochernes scorpioides TaxID=51811 RepID=A0ABY6JYA6_9ARAC|nr:hypothetical protein LAZ67_1000989 [Cordylochernes scorpioides]